MIYIVKQGTKFVKIGYASNIEKRLAQLQTASPLKLKLVAVLPGSYKTEKSLHEEFASLKTKQNNEWFRYDGKLKACLIAYKDQNRKHEEIKTVKQFLENGLHLQCRQKFNRKKRAV